MNSSRPLAVVTGASSGIGYSLAREFVAQGHDVVIAAEDEGIHEAALDLRFHGARVRVVQADLATYAGAESLVHEVRAEHRPVSAVVLNAGIGQGGAFLETDLADLARVIDLNVSSTVHLARRLLPAVADQGGGRLLITSSVAAEAPGPFQAVYNASEAFLRSFGLALRAELQDTGVTVTVLLPGATDTRFFVRAGLLNTRIGRSRKDAPELVARQAYHALMAGHAQVVAGSLHTRAQELATRALPAPAKAALHRHRARPGGSRSHL